MERQMERLLEVEDILSAKIEEDLDATDKENLAKALNSVGVTINTWMKMDDIETRNAPFTITKMVNEITTLVPLLLNDSELIGICPIISNLIVTYSKALDTVLEALVA